MFVRLSGVVSTLVIKLLFLRKLSFLSIREGLRILLAADSEKRAQNIDFRSKTGEFSKNRIFTEIDSSARK